ncbi:alpha/beta hydrolase [Alloscardovia theropitheci]|uniref:Alpha/beta hydrolase n=1 Tax=Alloscardovia theropitheci TaxID=2496842 RepID=A0A4R0QXQ8_9BIFI|nr:alpha/beta hydrolase [Alloscardovia theropitheci]TCD54271.1 alpha/beta hydrolase [Alloscardovia theropitheci]
MAHPHLFRKIATCATAGFALVAGAAWAYDWYTRKKFNSSALAYEMNRYYGSFPRRSAQEEAAWFDEERGKERPNKGLPELAMKLGLATVFDDGSDVSSETYGLTTYCFKPSNFTSTIAPHTTILYIHGGAYVKGFNGYNTTFLTCLAHKFGVTVLAPDYDTAPYGDALTASRQITALYKQYRSSHPYERVILMGDSAGAGLALGLALQWAKEHNDYATSSQQTRIPVPEGIIVISPWVDTTLENPEISQLTFDDPYLRPELLRVDAHEWAGGLSQKDYRISPIYGNLESLSDSPVTVIMGSNEIFYPDVALFVDKLRNSRVEVKFHVAEAMTHDYALLPIPESRESFRWIKEAIERATSR